jgi:hypothetical protein
MVTITRAGVQSNFECSGLCIAINRSILTEYKARFVCLKIIRNLPAINVNIDTATDVPKIKNSRDFRSDDN